MFKRFIKPLLSLFAACLLWQSSSFALQFYQINHIYFFGDSLSDSGFNDLWPTVGNPPFLPPLPPGKAPTFTTFRGYIWSQYIAHDIKGITLPVYPGPTPGDVITNNSCCVVPGFSSGTLNGFDYAAGGSTTAGPGFMETWAPSLYKQVQTFLTTPNRVVYPNDVFFIWEGANDILTTLLVTNSLPALLQTAQTAAANIAIDVYALSRAGAQRFVIMSLPNIGRAPLITVMEDPVTVGQVKNLSFTFDGMLNQALGLIPGRQNLKIVYVNVYTLLDTVIDFSNAGKPYYVLGQPFLFTNTKDPVCGFTTPAVYCTSGSNGYIFADLLHPTDTAHRLISLQVETAILTKLK